MTKNIYVMFDKVSKTWTLPFFEVNNEKVIRDFQYLINEKMIVKQILEYSTEWCKVPQYHKHKIFLKE